MKYIVIFLVVAAVCACQSNPATPKKSLSSAYIDRQLKIIEDHAKILADEGRMPTDLGDKEHYLAEYGWHAGSEARSVGSQPPLWLLQEGSRQGTGSFGAYSFHQPAFEQAKQQWWIHGVIEKGKSLLYPVNRNASFDPTIVGHKIRYMYGIAIDATVVEVQGKSYAWQSWGSDGKSEHGKEVWHGPLKLDKPFPDDGKEPRFVYQYDVAILAPDYVDMCQCTTEGR